MGVANPQPPPALFTASNPPYQPGTRVPIVSFETRDVQPPSIVYVTSADALTLLIASSLAAPKALLRYRVLRADGQIVYGSEPLAFPGDRALHLFQFALPEGFLLSASVFAQELGTVRGTVWVNGAITRSAGNSGDTQQSLFADYVTLNAPASWPGGRIISSVEGPGNITTVSIASPPAGQFVTVTPPAATRWRVLSATAQLATDAAGGNRNFFVEWKSTAGSGGKYFCKTSQAPSTAMIYVCGQLGETPTSPLASTAYVNLPAGMYVNGTIEMIFDASGLDVGDVFVNCSLIVEEWLELQ